MVPDKIIGIILTVCPTSIMVSPAESFMYFPFSSNSRTNSGSKMNLNRSAISIPQSYHYQCNCMSKNIGFSAGELLNCIVYIKLIGLSMGPLFIPIQILAYTDPKHASTRRNDVSTNGWTNINQTLCILWPGKRNRIQNNQCYS